VADAGQDDRRNISALRMNDQRGRAEEPIETRASLFDLADVMQDQLVDPGADALREPEVGQNVMLTGEACEQPTGTPVPQNPFPRKGEFHRRQLVRAARERPAS
jgi:hypothetical protein